MQSKEKSRFGIFASLVPTFYISNFNCNYVGLIATMILIFDQAWGQNVSFLKLVLWLLMALDGTVKSILIRLDFDGLSRCTTVDGCQKIKV